MATAIMAAATKAAAGGADRGKQVAHDQVCVCWRCAQGVWGVPSVIAHGLGSHVAHAHDAHATSLLCMCLNIISRAYTHLVFCPPSCPF